MNKQQFFVDLLKKEFQLKKKQNSYYSMRALARDTEITQSELSRIMGSKRKLSPQLAYKVGQYLQLSQAEMCEFVLSTLHE